MKKHFYALLAAGALATCADTKSLAQQQPDSCSELFISEIFVEKRPIQGNEVFDLNYAVEIFNPTQSTIQLKDYKLELTDGFNVTTIPLSDSVAAGATYVVVNTYADSNLQNVANQLNAGLDFGNNVALSLFRDTTVIDRIGQNGQPTWGAFDVAQFLADPYNYLLTYHFDLNDYNNVDVRRGMFVTAGDPTMVDATELIGNWAYFPNQDRTDLGQHYGMCNKPAVDDIFGYVQTSFDFFTSNLNDIDPITIKVNNTTNGSPFNLNPTLSHVQQPSSTTSICNTGAVAFPSLEWAINGPTSTSCTTITFTYTPVNTPRAKQTAFSSNNIGKSCTIKLQSSTSTAKIDPASSLHTMFIKSNTSVGSEALAKKCLVYPSVTLSDLHVRAELKLRYRICDMSGAIVHKGQIDETSKYIATSALPSGFYLLHFEAADGSAITQKFVKL